MVCNHCGAYNDPQAATCTVCGTQLKPEPAVTQHVPQEPETEEAERPNWGFARSPRWPKPSFDLNTVDELPEEEEYVRPHDPNAPLAPQDPAAQPPYDAYAPPVRGFRNVDMPGRFNPQPMQGAQQSHAPVQPIGSVGGYDDEPVPYQRGFGRAPQQRTAGVGYGAPKEEQKAPAARKPQYPPAKSAAATTSDSLTCFFIVIPPTKGSKSLRYLSRAARSILGLIGRGALLQIKPAPSAASLTPGPKQKNLRSD